MYNVNSSDIWFESFKANFGVTNDDIFHNDQKCSPFFITKRKVAKLIYKRVVRPLGFGPNDFFLLQKSPEIDSEELIKKYVSILVENRKKWDSIILSEIPSNDPCWEKLVNKLQLLRFKVNVDKKKFFYHLDVTGNWEDYYKRLKIRDIKTRYNRVRTDNLSYEVIVITSGIERYLDEILSFYNQRRQSTNQNNSFGNITNRNMLLDVIPKYEKEGWVMLSILRGSDNKNWAYQLDFLKDGIQYHYAPTFDMSYSRYSPSKILLLETIKNAFGNDKINEFNFMRGEADYKSQFTQTKSAYVKIEIENKYSLVNRMTKIYNRFSYLFLIFKKNSFLCVV